jgi:hypothetical protein
MPQTIGNLIAEARTLLQDKNPSIGLRYTDAEMLEAFNSGVREARAKRPDLFLTLGLRVALPTYGLVDPFPLDPAYSPVFVNYLVGRTELREDPFSEDSRAVTMLNKFVTGLLTVQS